MSEKEPAVGDRVLYAGEDDMHEAIIIRLGFSEHREALVRDDVGNELWFMFEDLEWVNSEAPDREAEPAP